MRLWRCLRPELIKLEMDPREPFEEEGPISKERHVREVKFSVLRELVDLMTSSGDVCNPNKLFIDLRNRELKASTAIGKGVALPHVRTMQARSFIMALARSSPGIDFDSMDGGLSHLFFAMAAPPYDDSLYLRVFKSLAEALSRDEIRTGLMEATTPDEIIRTLSSI